MSGPGFPSLFSPFRVKGLTLKNRLFVPGHMTMLAEGGVPNEDLAAYYAARAEGGAAMVTVEAAAVHATARRGGKVISAADDACIPGYRRIVEVCRPAACAVFGQLFHPGRETTRGSDGSLLAAYAPSSVPNERFKVMPAAMSTALIAEVVAGYGAAAARLEEAGLDGVEIVANMGYLPAQFLNPRVNRREDGYGGDLDGRLRFLKEALAAIRARCGPGLIVGLRLSGDEMTHDGLVAEEVLAVCRALDGEGVVDYLNVIGGSSAGIDGAIHIAPPMVIANAYLAPLAAAVKAAVACPVFVAGRINQAQEAERVIAAGQADLCGMTRALISDPQLPAKAAAGRSDDIRACIACNQACIGHEQQGFPISCIQRPESGRERPYGRLRLAAGSRRVMVVGGGPAGMKAAAVAAARGHVVSLYEQELHLGGQALLAQRLPGRAEFGGLVTNLARELELAQVTVLRNCRVDAERIRNEAPETVIVASGARPYRPAIAGDGSLPTFDAWQVIRDEVRPGPSVVIADWRCDWVGLGLAEKLARDGARVRLCVAGTVPGESLQPYVRDHWMGVIHGLGVEVLTYLRLYGCDEDEVYLQHVASGAPVVLERVDALVLALGHSPVTELAGVLADFPGAVRWIGDCLAPRTAEEAVLEGLVAGTEM